MEAVEGPALTATPAFGELEQHRRELTAYCYRMLGSPFEAEDAVQDTLLRAWKSIDRFEGRSALRSWLYRIATNVCLDMRSGPERRSRTPTSTTRRRCSRKPTASCSSATSRPSSATTSTR